MSNVPVSSGDHKVGLFIGIAAGAVDCRLRLNMESLHWTPATAAVLSLVLVATACSGSQQAVEDDPATSTTVAATATPPPTTATTTPSTTTTTTLAPTTTTMTPFIVPSKEDLDNYVLVSLLTLGKDSPYAVNNFEPDEWKNMMIAGAKGACAEFAVGASLEKAIESALFAAGASQPYGDGELTFALALVSKGAETFCPSSAPTVDAEAFVESWQIVRGANG